MGPSKGTIKTECSHLTENWEVPQYDIRLMRRLKRRSISSEMMEHNSIANAKRKNVGSCGLEVVKNSEYSGHVLEEEVDEDYGFFLDKVVFHVDVISDNNNIIASDIDGDTDVREDDESYILKFFVDNQLFSVKYEGQKESLHDLVNNELQCGGDDEDYQLFLSSLRIEGDNLVCMLEGALTVKYGGSKSEGMSSKARKNLQDPFKATKLSNNSRQASDDYHHVAKNKRPSEVLSDVVDDDGQIYLNSKIAKYSEEKYSAVWKNLQVFNEATELPKAKQVSDIYHVDKHKNEVQCGIDDEDYQLFLNSSRLDGDCLICMPKRAITIKYGGSESEGKSSKIRKNLQVSNEATEHPNAKQDLSASHVSKCHSKVLCNIMDENYQLFLKSVSTDGDNLIYIPENGVKVVYGEECDQSSTDSEPIILDPSQHCRESPSICSKSYHSSCLANERNQKDSLYRKGLMEELERPYNQKELDKLLQVVSHERTKMLHREMRHGVTKDRPKRGDDNKTSYLKMHSGLKDAINQVKEPHKVLFLLRGFFYWLKHVPQGGAFQPWLDASCLKMLQQL